MLQHLTTKILSESATSLKPRVFAEDNESVVTISLFPVRLHGLLEVGGAGHPVEGL